MPNSVTQAKPSIITIIIASVLNNLIGYPILAGLLYFALPHTGLPYALTYWQTLLLLACTRLLAGSTLFIQNARPVNG